MASRPVWEGHLRLSLVTCPVALHRATRDGAGAVRFHLLNPETHNRVKQAWKDAAEGTELDRRDLVRGYEVEKDTYVVVEDAELEALRLESTKVIDIGVAQGFVEKSGSWFSYNGERIGQGKENARTFLDQHPEIAREIEGKIREKLLPGKGEAVKGEATVQ